MALETHGRLHCTTSEDTMKTLGIAALGAVLLAAFASPSQAQNIVVWRAIIGIAQAGNVVGGITGGGQPWSTREGEVLVERQYDRDAGCGEPGQRNAGLRTRFGQPDRR